MPREPREPRNTARQQRFESYEREWLEHRNRSRQRTQQKHRILRGSEFIHALELAANATGDPRFMQALEAAKFYGFDKEFQRTASRIQGEMFGGGPQDYLVQVDFLHLVGKLEGDKRRKLSVREACEMVVAESGYPAHSFLAAVEQFRKFYMSPQHQADPRFRHLCAPSGAALRAKFLVKNPRSKKTRFSK
jgi:hypothetical protein